MTHVRTVTFAACLALLGAAAAAAQPPGESTAGCEATARRANAAAEAGSAPLLGAVLLPGVGRLARPASRTRKGPWRYFRRASLSIRSGATAVSVTVPEGWRDRVAVSWGGGAPASVVRFDACTGVSGWNEYAGGFHLRTRGDCIPLVVQVGGRSTTVRLGLGRECGRR